MGRFLLQTGSMRGYFGNEGAVLYLDCGNGYKTLYILSKLTDICTEILVNFILCTLFSNQTYKQYKNRFFCAQTILNVQVRIL